MTGENPSLLAEAGSLYVVATPIGNMADLSERAKAILETVDSVACEDTRVTGLLLNRIGLKKNLVPYHDQNEQKIATSLVDKIENGASIALVSDAGTPAISDPGFRIVRECRKRSLPVIPIPGPSALIALLSSSGVPTDSFLYVGFLPPKSAARLRFFEQHKLYERTIIVYESCHRIEKFMAEMNRTFEKSRTICIGREITKKFETIITGPLETVYPKFLESSKKGEFVIAIAPYGYEL